MEIAFTFVARQLRLERRKMFVRKALEEVGEYLYVIFLLYNLNKLVLIEISFDNCWSGWLWHAFMMILLCMELPEVRGKRVMEWKVYCQHVWLAYCLKFQVSLDQHMTKWFCNVLWLTLVFEIVIKCFSREKLTKG